MNSSITAARNPSRQGIEPAYIFTLTIGLSWFLPAEFFTAGIGLIYVLYALYSSRLANMGALRFAGPFLFMAAYALLMSSANERYDIGKDAWYAIKLILCLTLGFLIGWREINSRKTLQLLLYCSVVVAIWAIVAWVRFGDQVEQMAYYYDQMELVEVPRLPLFAVVAIPLLLERLKIGRGASALRVLLMLSIILFAVAISNSRTTILAAGALILAWAGFLSNWRRALLGGLIVALIIALLWQYLPNYEAGNVTVLSKFRHSLDEIMLTDAYDSTQVTLNWRGFEAYNAQLMFDQASLIQKLAGNGLGANVNLGIQYDMGRGMELQYLPILHNGFYYILVKYGLIGLLLYCVSVLRFANWRGVDAIEPNTIEERLRRGLVLAIFITTLVIAGLYNKTELHGLTLLAAWLAGYAYRQRIEAGFHHLPKFRRARFIR